MASSEIKTFLQLGSMSDKGEFVPFGINEIELEVCSYAFIRELDGLTKIGTDLRGGNISFVSTKIPAAGILEWGVKANKYYSGCIHFRDASGKAESRLYFENAACVSLKIVYENEGQSYMMVQGALQAEILTLDGAGRRFRNIWTNHPYMDTSYNASSEATAAAADFMGVILNPEASLTAEMTLNGKDYELRSFEMEFSQEFSSRNGEPQSTVRGGIASISLFQLPDGNINNWLVGSDEASGEFRFGAKTFGYPLKITFSRARCAGLFAQCMNNSTQNKITRMNIAAMTMSLNGVPYKNHSIKQQ